MTDEGVPEVRAAIQLYLNGILTDDENEEGEDERRNAS